VDDAWYFLADSRFRKFESAPNPETAAAARAAAKPLTERRFKDASGNERWSEFRPRALHLLARVHHVLGELDDAIELYRRAGEIEDAREALAFLTAERLAMDDTVAAGVEGGAKFPVRYRNVKQVTFKTYPVDLQVLFAVRKTLEGLNRIDLSGIVPSKEWTVTFADAGDHGDHEVLVDLPVEAGAPGVWLVVAKAGTPETGLHEAGTLVVKTDLKATLQTVGEKARVYVTDAAGRGVRGAYVTVASAGQIRARGLTDGRGVFEAPGVGANPAAVVSKDDRYALGR
jgi:hypothetical protein